MKEEYLNEIIETLELNSSTKDAFFKHDYEKGLKVDGFIHTNKDGLLLYAKELLKAVNKFEEVRLNKDKMIFLDTSEWYFYGKETINPYVKPIYKSRKLLIEQLTFKEKIKDKLSLVSYFLTIIIVVVLVFIGFFQVLNLAKEAF